MTKYRTDEPPQDIMEIAAAYGIPSKFSAKVRREADKLPQEVTEEILNKCIVPDNDLGNPESNTGNTSAEKENSGDEGNRKKTSKTQKDIQAARLDLRALPTVTIDGEDTKDFDDAISLVRCDTLPDRTGSGKTSHGGPFWQLGVHIADVAEYVTEGSALDKEALRRGTSFYPAGRVIPMLPAALSNGICALCAGTDRLALSCLMTIDSKGTVLDYQIAESVIHVDARLTYGGVERLLESGDESEIAQSLSTQGYRGIKKRTKKLAVMLRRCARIAGSLREKRIRRGCLGFDLPEAKIELDETGWPVSIKASGSSVSTELIEDFMILANETVARHCCLNKIPCVYRVHEAPEKNKINELRIILRRCGYQLKPRGGQVEPKEIAAVLSQLQGDPMEEALSRITLRCMQRAVYETSCGGHFGLALTYYCHFTSPIRRYPDLLVHRSLKDWLHGRMTPERKKQLRAVLPDMARQSSDREQKAMEAEREAAKLKKTQYMLSHIGEVYTGVISGVTDFGLFVELPNTVEGMIYIGDLPGDYYYYGESQYVLVGERTGKRYALGDEITVVVKNANPARRHIDFEIYDDAYDAVPGVSADDPADADHGRGMTGSRGDDADHGRSMTGGRGTDADHGCGKTGGRGVNADHGRGKTGGRGDDADHGRGITGAKGDDSDQRHGSSGGRGTDADQRRGKTGGRGVDADQRNERFGGKTADEEEERSMRHGGRARQEKKRARTKMDRTGRVHKRAYAHKRAGGRAKRGKTR